MVYQLVSRSNLRIYYAIKITTIWRGFRRRTIYSSKRKAMIQVALKLNCYIRIFLSRRFAVQFTQNFSRVAEMATAGRVMFKHSREMEIQHQILVQSGIHETYHASELQHIFSTYCSYGQKDNITRLGVGNFSRLVKEAPNIMQPLNKKGLSPSDVELTFMKCRGRSKHSAIESHLHYAEFLKSIHLLADSFFTSVPRCGRHVGSDAKLCIFLQKYIFQSKVAMAQSNMLLTESCVGRADAQLEASTQFIISLWRNYQSRIIAGTRKQTHSVHLSERRRNHAVIDIQRVCRGVAGRGAAADIAQEIYEKFVDFKSRREFWFNKNAKTSVWKKPQALAWLDVGNPIIMPSVDLLFEVRCPQCSKYSIEKYCVECDDLYCGSCHAMHNGHCVHTHVNIDSCVQCHFQIGT